MVFIADFILDNFAQRFCSRHSRLGLTRTSLFSLYKMHGAYWGAGFSVRGALIIFPGAGTYGRTLCCTNKPGTQEDGEEDVKLSNGKGAVSQYPVNSAVPCRMIFFGFPGNAFASSRSVWPSEQRCCMATSNSSTPSRSI